MKSAPLQRMIYGGLGFLACFSILGASVAAPVLQAEKSDVATLPPIAPHWVLVQTAPGGMTVYDADKGRILGTVPVNLLGNVTVSRDFKYFYVAETMWSEDTRGIRQDLLAIYDAHKLNLVQEIKLPPRALTVFKNENFTLSGDGSYAYVFNMRPATSITVVDMKLRKVKQTIDIPGCGLSYPWRQGGFSSLCGDGSLVNLAVDQSGKVSVLHSKPFFDANNDPVFEASIDDVKNNEAFFISYTGKVYPVKLGPAPVIGAAWSLQQAAGQPAAGIGVQNLAWRPGGNQIAAYHHASRKLFVLMHIGNHWTQKMPGTEVWVFDTVKRKLLQRIGLEKPTKSIAVSQDGAPQLYAVDGTGNLAVLDAGSGRPLRGTSFSGGGPLLAAAAF